MTEDRKIKISPTFELLKDPQFIKFLKMLARQTSALIFLGIKTEVVLCDCGKSENEKFSPCCSFECWHKKFN